MDTEFRARLKTPRREYVLGAVIKAIEPKIARNSGRPYATVSFENYPMFFTLGEVKARWIRTAMDEAGLVGELLVPGDELNLDVKWRAHPVMDPLTGKWSDIIYPDPMIDIRAHVQRRKLFAALIQEGRA